MYNFYIQRTDAKGNAIGEALDLERDFAGLLYRACTGIEAVGKPKNIYFESYPESDGQRVFHPEDSGLSVAHESTEVSLELLFVGDDRRKSLSDFRKVVEKGRLFYWDTARKKKVWLVLVDKTEPEEDNIRTGGQFIKITFKFTNLWGIGKNCNNQGILL